ncbi:SixA phosphatase family protein [Membranihabitans maritimus]|uniref:SixA phosphatase family protein n=1 Tax=Membranihabitans maritimus TaxID=2904244 RepID=UPI001F26A6AD|nr:histidine phosphatase family protein [Membranihabitans maritimus]
MKTFYLIRHAKSKHGLEFNSDFERTLDQRGKEEAVLVSSFLKDNGFTCEAFISSSAKRALETEQLFYETLDYQMVERENTADLYLPSGEKIWEVINRQDDTYSQIAFFTHNPGVGEFLMLLDEYKKTPTCFFGQFESKCNHWKEVDVRNTKLINFITPKILSQ